MLLSFSYMEPVNCIKMVSMLGKLVEGFADVTLPKLWNDSKIVDE